jgi:alpha-tubulin suppressor-like RCC1 family protein
MSERYLGGFVSLSFNPLGAQTTTTYYDAYIWGENGQGQLGLSTTANVSSPTQIGSNVAWTMPGEGANFSALVKGDGTLWTWGRNDAGQIGDGTTVNKSSPVQVGTLTNWSIISPGSQFCLAIKTDGTLWSWGLNNEGQLGLNNAGSTTWRSSPVQVGGLNTWASIAASSRSYHALAIQTNGTLWAWGYNAYGQVGDGTTAYRSSPKQIGSLTNWAYVAKTTLSSIAIKTNGTLWTWGRNNTGQLGLNNGTYYSSPKQVGALTNWTSQISGGQYTVCAIKSDGTLWSWGYNNYGQLGLGNTTNYSSPKQVGALTTWSKICAMQSSGAAIKTDGTLWAWGRNNAGQLGFNNITDYSSPKQVGSETTWSVLPKAGDFFLTAWK